MKAAVITGASAGLGLQFVAQLEKYFPQLDEVWLIARSEDKLLEASKLLQNISPRVVPLNLCSEKELDNFAELIEMNKPDIRLLVNNAGCGFLGNIGETSYKEQNRMVDLNIRALTAVTGICLPFMSEDSRIINISSIASFCPNPRMTVYSASKSFVSAFSRGLGEELKERNIKVTAVCSGPMSTDFLDIAGIRGNSKTFELLPYCKPEKVVEGAYKASIRGKAVHTPRLFFKFYRIVAKILPQYLMVKFTKT